MRLYGIGTSSETGPCLALLFGNRVLLIKILNSKLKTYYYNNEEHKPVISKFFGVVTDEIYPDQDNLGKY